MLYSDLDDQNRIPNVFRFKDQIRKYMNLKVIYKFKYNICNDIYTGETKRHFLVREYEHRRKSVLAEKNLKYTEKDATAIRNHCHNHCYTVDTSCFSLVGKAANKYQLKFKESLLILKMKQFNSNTLIILTLLKFIVYTIA